MYVHNINVVLYENVWPSNNVYHISYVTEITSTGHSKSLH